VAAAAEKSDAEKEKEEEQKKSLIAKIAARMAQLSPGFVGADIAAICNEGAILAARRGESAVTMSHLEDSVDRVIAGVEHRSRKLSEFELKVVAHHEAGHAVAGWYLDRADPLMKVSIVPRSGKALGYAQYLPNENQVDTSKDIIDSICVTLGGRVAEMIFFNHLSTGAADDLQKVTRMAYTHVCSFGSVTAHIPPGTPQTQYSKPYGERVSKRIDQQAKELVDKAFQRTFDLLTSKKADVEKLAQHLMKHEAMTHADVVSLLGVRTPSKKGH
jgi:AFG3 family protein